MLLIISLCHSDSITDSKLPVITCQSPHQRLHNQFPSLFSHNISQRNRNATTWTNMTLLTNTMMVLMTKDGTTQDSRVMVVQLQFPVQLLQFRTTTTSIPPQPQLQLPPNVNRTITFHKPTTTQAPTNTTPHPAPTDSSHPVN